MKKYIEEFSYDEIVELIKENTSFKYKVSEYMAEGESSNIEDQLHYLKTTDYSIGAYSYDNYLKYEHADQFILSVLDLEESIPLFSDEEKENMGLDNFEDKVKEYRSTEVYSKKFEDLEEEIESIAKYLSESIIKRMVEYLELDHVTEDDLATYAYDLVEELFDGYYIKDGDLQSVNKDITITI